MLTIERLGKYEVVGQIGEGGFGTVWSGRDPLLKRSVAIKTCESESAELRQRFLREAEIAASLHHPNIVVVHDFGYEDGIPYLVEEFLTGEDLSKLIARREPVPLATKLRWLAEVCRGLDYAHAHGVIHRDIKPGNVRIQEDGSAKVLDFGIAKLAESDTEHLTKTGTAIGTVGYMAPEQLDGRPVDYRADVFSFGVLAYELLAYRRPFEGETVSRVFYQLLHEDPPPLAARAPEIPADLERLVRRCLAKDPDGRYGSFRTLLDDLERVATGEPLDLDSTGELTTDLGQPERMRPTSAAPQVPAGAPFAPTMIVGGERRHRARRPLLVAFFVALAAVALWLALLNRRPELTVAPGAAGEAAGEVVLDLSAVTPPEPPPTARVADATPGAAPLRASPRPEPVATAAPPSAPAPAGEESTAVAEAADPEDSAIELAEKGPGVVLPRIVEGPSLGYPPLARRARFEGVVALGVLIDAEGRVQEVKLLGEASGYDLDAWTIAYARDCRWAPGTRNGVPVPMWKELRIRYSLKGSR